MYYQLTLQTTHRILMEFGNVTKRNLHINDKAVQESLGASGGREEEVAER